jgi:sugar phosphate isomerase/epimerase
VSTLRFGVSTHLYHDQRLDREHLVEIAAHGFDCIELFATRSHFDYHDGIAVRTLAEWLEDTRLALNSVHAPICASFSHEGLREPFSTAISDEEQRRRTLAEAEAALAVSQTIPYRHLVVHLGVPDALAQGTSDNSREAARRSIEELVTIAEPAGVQLALEVIPNQLSTAEALVSFIENELEGARVGICMDVGHAFLMGDLGDAIETCSGHLVTTHIHDNRRQSDDHLAPGDGGIDWPAALMTLQKIGYDGTWLFEVANVSTPKTVLEKTAAARERFDQLLRFDFEEN